MLPMNTADLPRDFLGIAFVVLLLGIRHGFDADHLAAIDGMTRFNAAARPRLARLAGVLFSIGHGLVVVCVALGVSVLAQSWQAPRWLEAFGAWVSIGVLTLLALMNIAAVLRTPPDELTHLAGWRSGGFARLLCAGSPVMVTGVGMLFALSFDTISQAALFAVTATQFGGWRPALLLALLFVSGMLVTDGVNGWWIARLVRRADRTARVASRVMALAVAAVGLLTAALSVAGRTLPGFEVWTRGNELWFGVAVVAVVWAGFAVGQRRARDRPRPVRAVAPGSTPPSQNDTSFVPAATHASNFGRLNR